MDSFFCKSLPKIELHAHLNGSLSSETLKELRQYNKQNEKSQIDDETWGEWERTIFQRKTWTLSECFEIFKIAHSVTNNPEAVKLATTRVIENFESDNVVYLELRSTLRSEPNMSKVDYIQAMIDGIEDCKSLKIMVKLIISINRKESLENSEENVDIALEYAKSHPDIIVGIDVSGDPLQKKFTDYVDMLGKARKEGLKTTIHCGEIPDDKEVSDILNFNPDRLGHCTCIHESHKGNHANWTELLKKKIPVELCITSNVKCETVSSADQHHFKYLYEASHPIVLGTDDMGVFDTTLSKEYEIASKSFNLTKEDLWNISYKSIDYIFSGETDKIHLRNLLKQWKLGNLN